MTRKYGKKLPDVPWRKGYARGGFVDSFGDPVVAHINAEGGITEGESPEERNRHYPGKVSKIACWSEYSTFNRPSGPPTYKSAYDQENDAKNARDVYREPGSYAKGGLVKKKGKK